ncbi:MAG: hypothetical protein HZC14_01170 [Candidatus Niyogibacteria bacterium]|nr:hypothetical protein [Candidatus Niyogibacteria bacterium]
MLRLNFWLEKFKERIIPSQDLIKSECLSAIKSCCKVGVGYKIAFRKPVILIETGNAALRNEIIMKKGLILDQIKERVHKDAPSDIKFVTILS